ICMNIPGPLNNISYKRKADDSEDNSKNKLQKKDAPLPDPRIVEQVTFLVANNFPSSEYSSVFSPNKRKAEDNEDNSKNKLQKYEPATDKELAKQLNNREKRTKILNQFFVKCKQINPSLKKKIKSFHTEVFSSLSKLYAEEKIK